jgi:hypothetical protein
VDRAERARRLARGRRGQPVTGAPLLVPAVSSALRRTRASALLATALLQCACNAIFDIEDPRNTEPPPDCVEGALNCFGAIPQSCSGGRWQPLAPCGASAPVCSGGVCVPFRLSGHWTDVEPTLEAASLRLVDHGLMVGSRTCAPVAGEMLCVKGALQP